MLIFSCAPLFLWAEAIATACYTHNRSIIHRQFDKTPYELINGRKLDISFLHVFRALCYPKNDREDIEKLGEKGDIGFFIGYSTNSCAYRNDHGDIRKLGTKGDIGFFIDYSADSCAYRTLTTSTTTADTTPTPTNSSSQTANIPNTSQDVDELKLPQQHDQQQDNQALLQPEIADNVPNTMFDGHVFENPFTPPSTSAAESSSSQYVDPLNMHTFYQPYPHEYQWTMDHPLEQVIGEPSRPVLTRNQLRTDGDICIYALTMSTIEPRNVKEPMIELA
ncbi:retrovirus-related pol polyprotein from transposon TNT 1-94 [Tanacetum coccineum]